MKEFENKYVKGERVILDKGLTDERVVKVLSSSSLLVVVEDDYGNRWSVLKERLSRMRKDNNITEIRQK